MAIDLGSAYTCVGIIDNGRVKTITNSFGNKFTPSVVSQMNEKIMIGEEA
jgi:heat shock protein 1/8